MIYRIIKKFKWVFLGTQYDLLNKQILIELTRGHKQNPTYHFNMITLMLQLNKYFYSTQ